MDNLVIGPLKEGGIDRNNRFKPSSGKARSKCNRMLFGDPDIIEPVREARRKTLKACTFLHGRSDGNDPRSFSASSVRHEPKAAL